MYVSPADFKGVAERSATTRPTFIDAFAGCGGLSLGLKRAGWAGLFAIEKDDFAFRTLSSNFGDDCELRYNWPASIERKAWDIRALLEERLSALHALRGTVDLIAGGPPCQGFSHAGRRKHDDPRNQLFDAYLELVDAVQPRIVLLENVRGFTSDFKKGKAEEIENFAATLNERLGTNYVTTSKVLRASDYGVPQARPRFFLVGVKRSDPAAHLLPSLFQALDGSASGFLAARGISRTTTARDAISDLEISFSGKIPCPECKGFDAIAYRKPRTPFQVLMRDGSKAPPSDTRLARHRPDIRDRFAAIIKAGRDEGRLNVTISAETRRAFNLKKMAIRVLDPLSPAPTITSLPDDLLHYTEARTLTVRENARLQTFPDWFAFHGKYTTGGTLRTREVPRFTQVANAVPPLLAEQIGATLLSVLTNVGDVAV